jgi:hypothetical protein
MSLDCMQHLVPLETAEILNYGLDLVGEARGLLSATVSVSRPAAA